MLKLMQNSIRRSKKISLSKYKACGNRLYYRNRLVIPNYNKLKLKLLKHVHDLPITGYLG